MSLAAVSSTFFLAPTFHLDIKHTCYSPEPMEQHKIHDDDDPINDASLENNAEEEDRPGQFDIWHAIQSRKAAADRPVPASGAAVGNLAAPYVHPLMRRSSSLLSQKSLEVCTESLGSETGSDDFSSSCDGLDYYFSAKVDAETNEERKRDALNEMKQPMLDDAPKYSTVIAEDWRGTKGKELTSVNYHCSIGRRTPPRSFPPPLPSISRRDGPCVHMRPHRRDGRLVVEAVAVPSQNYLHAQREGGRLLLSFIDAAVDESKNLQCSDVIEDPLKQDEIDKITSEEYQEEQRGAQIVHPSAENQDWDDGNSFDIVAEEDEEDEDLSDEVEEEEEEVEVVDRGTVVEVKVRTQPLQQSSATKVVRSSLVINKFVGGMPLSGTATGEYDHALDRIEPKSSNNCTATAAPPARRAVPTTTTTPAAAAAVAASTLSTISTDGYDEYHGTAASPPLDNKLLFTSKRRNREDLLHNMRRCNQLRQPLFIWEPCCIATSS